MTNQFIQKKALLIYRKKVTINQFIQKKVLLIKRKKVTINHLILKKIIIFLLVNYKLLFIIKEIE